jgi:hypothetical protein
VIVDAMDVGGSSSLQERVQHHELKGSCQIGSNIYQDLTDFNNNSKSRVEVRSKRVSLPNLE